MSLPETYQSAVWADSTTLEVRNVPLVAPGPGEVLVRIRACGICGSDLHGFHTGQRMVAPGIGPGHELAGEVAALGPGVAGPPVGTRVALFAGRVCLSCEFCRGGRIHLCPKLRIAGAAYAGGMGEYFMAQAGLVYPLPDGMPWEVAALSEPCGISLHALKRAGVRQGQRVFVIGAGAIGLFATLVASAAGASRIGVAARHPHQAEAARRLGATDIFSPDEVGANTPLAGMGWDIVVETVGGSVPTLQQAIDLCIRGGVVALLGVHTTPQAIQTWRLFLHEVSIIGSFGYDHTGARSDYEVTLELLSRYQDVVAPLVTHTYPLDRANEAFATALDKTTGAIKVTVLP